MTANSNYTFLIDNVFYTYQFENEGSYAAVSNVSVANDVYAFNVAINTTSLSISNSTLTFTLRSPTLAQKNDGNYYLNANGSWNLVSATASVNTDAQYVWNNTHIFNSNLTVNGSILTVNANASFAKISTFNANVILGSSGLSANGSFGTAGQVLHSNGTATYWAADDAGGGTVTSVASGNGLSGGPITTTGTLSVLANTGIVSNTTGLYVNSDYIGTLTANNSTFAFGKSEGNLNVNSAIYANGSITNTFTVGTSAYFVANGNIGIGNSTPTGTLVINQGAVVNKPAFIINNIGAGTSGIAVGAMTIGYQQDWGRLTAIRVTNKSLAYVHAGIANAQQGAHRFSTDGTGGTNLGANGSVVDVLAPTTASNIFQLRQADETRVFNVAYNGDLWVTGNTGIGNTTPNAKLQVTGTANISGNVAIGGISTFDANVVLGSVGLSSNGSFGTAGHVLHSNGTATYWAADDNSGGTVTSVATGNGMTGGTITGAGTVSVLANTGIVANATGVFVNAAYIGTLTSNNATNAFGKTEGALNVNSALTANNSTNLGGIAASGYQTTAGLSANVATLTSNNSTNFGGQLPAFYTNATNITTGTLPYAQIPANIINTTAAFTISGVHTYNANIILGSSGLSSNGSFGTAGHVLHSNGTATYWAADDNSGGTVTSVASGNGITGGTITSSGTLTAVAGAGVVVNTSGINVLANNGITSNSTGTFAVAANGISVTAAGINVLGGPTLTVNTTGAHVNSTLSIGTLTTTGNVVIGGNLVVSGSFTVASGNVVTFTDNMLYLNQGVFANINNITSNGTHVIFTANNNYSAGWDVYVSNVNPTSYNGTYTNIFAANATTFTVANTNTASYVSGGTARGKTDINPDIGIAAGYNDGTYHHTGIFRDASDGYWKVFDGYDPEPDESIFIDTANTSFNIANFWTNTVRLGNTSVYATINSTSYSGAANSATFLGAAGNFGNSTGIYTSGIVNAVSFTAGTLIANNSILRSPSTLTVVGGGATAEGGQIVIGYGNNLATTITGQANNTFNIDVTGGNTGSTPLLRIFAQNGDGTTTAILNAANTGRMHVGSTAEQTDSTFKVTGTANVTSTFRAGGAATMASTLNVTGVTTLSANLSVASALVRSWSATDTDIDSLLPGSTFGTIIEGAYNGHLVLGIRDNDASDSVSIISGGGDYATANTYDQSVAFFRADGRVSFGRTAPGTDLELYRDANTISSIAVRNANTGAAAQARFDLNTGTTNSFVVSALLDNAGSPYYTLASGTAVSQAVYDFNQHIFRSQSGATEYARFISNGNFGIGNSAPNAKLAVTGTANVSGNVAIAGITTFTGNVVLGSVGLSSNGSFGTAGQVLHSNGTATYWAADDSSGGTVTSVATGNGMTGGTITTTGTVSVLANTGIVANATGLYVNSTYIETLSANNASFLGGTAAASYVQNTDSRTLSGNLVFSGANVFFQSATLGGTATNFVNNFIISTNVGNGSFLRFYHYRHTTGGDWTGVSTRLQQRIDVTDMGYLEYNPSGYTHGIALYGGSGYGLTVSQTGQSIFGNTVFLGSVGLSANGLLGTAGHVLHSNGSATYWAADDNSGGTVTSVATGNGMTGGTITTTGTLTAVAGAGVVVNTSGINVLANNGIVANSTGTFVNANTGIVANATGVFVNAAYINTISSNSATFANSSVTNTFTVGTASYFVAGGNVGIGTSSPTNARLQIQRASSAAINGEIWGSDGTYWYQLNSRQSAGAYNPMVANNDHAFIYSDGTSNTGALVIGQWSSESRGIRIDAGGNVGISNSSPNARLAVTGTANISGNVVIGGTLISGSSITRRTDLQTGYSELANYVQQVDATNTSVFSIGQVSDNRIFLEARDESNNKGTLTLQPYGGTVNFGTASTLALSSTSVSANGGLGTAGQVLTSNGTATYWSTVTATVNTAAQFTWTNTHTFNSNTTFGNSTFANTTVTSFSGYSNPQALTSGVLQTNASLNTLIVGPYTVSSGNSLIIATGSRLVIV